jgi:hypothetical protein
LNGIRKSRCTQPRSPGACHPTSSHSEKSAPDVIKAFDDAVKVLLREVESLKSDLRAEKLWKRKERRQELHQLKATRFADEPQIEGTGPQKYRDVVRELFQRHYKELLRHARRHIGHDELAGGIPTNALEAAISWMKSPAEQ